MELSAILDKIDLKILTNYIKERLIKEELKKPISYEKYIKYKVESIVGDKKQLDFSKIKNKLNTEFIININNIKLQGKLLGVSGKKHNACVELYYPFSHNDSTQVSHLGGANTIEQDFREINARNRVEFELIALKKLVLQKMILLLLLENSIQ